MNDARCLHGRFATIPGVCLPSCPHFGQVPTGPRNTIPPTPSAGSAEQLSEADVASRVAAAQGVTDGSTQPEIDEWDRCKTCGEFPAPYRVAGAVGSPVIGGVFGADDVADGYDYCGRHVGAAVHEARQWYADTYGNGEPVSAVAGIPAREPGSDTSWLLWVDDPGDGSGVVYTAVTFDSE